MTPRRFRVAFSFAGEKRDFVAQVAAILAKKFSPKEILYDKYNEAEFARARLGVAGCWRSPLALRLRGRCFSQSSSKPRD